MKRVIGIALLVAGISLTGAVGASAHTNTVQTASQRGPSPDVVYPGGTMKAEANSCVNPGNPTGQCWYEGWQFRKKSVCIESDIPGAPLTAVAAMYRNVAGIAVYVRFVAGQCAAAGFPESQRVPINAYTAADKTGNMKDACAYTSPASYGYQTKVYIRVNVTAYQTTACGNYASGEWTDVFAHELGHAFGLSHAQPYVDSIMRDGHTTSVQDKKYLTSLYSDNPL